MLVYDIEIIKAVPGREPPIPGVEYCKGWDDKENMGVSVICAFDTWDRRFRVFTKENFAEFERLAANRKVAGFNSMAFDDVVCGHQGVKVETEYDLLQELWAGAGLARRWEGKHHAGFGLDATAKANGFAGKTGYGGLAPAQWQQGLYGTVIDYCLEDVRLTYELIQKANYLGELRDPRDPTSKLRVKRIST